MATVIKRPDALSLSGNMTPFVLFGGVGSTSFVLQKGTETILRQSYEYGSDGLVTIDLKSVIESNLSFTLNASRNNYQNDISGEFRAIIDGQPYSFTVVRSGVASLADTARNFLRQHFLTWQPRVKKVTYYTPEWLTYFAIDASTLRLKAYFPNGSTTDIHLCTCPAGRATTVNVQYAEVAGLLGHRYPSYYEIWAVSSGTKISESLYYSYSDVESEDEQWFLFENSLGGLDSFRAFGVNALKAEHEHQIAEMGETRKEFRVDTDRKYTKNTGHLDDFARRWLLDFFPSCGKYIYEASAIRKVIVSEDNVTNKSSDLPSSYTFTYQYAEVSPYLNLQRNESDIPDNIVIPDLSSPDFILPPRLAEYPRLSLTEGVLIPVFEPHNDKPGVTTYGHIHESIFDDVRDFVEEKASEIGILLNELKDSGFGQGGGSEGSGERFFHITSTDQKTEPSDENAFTALRTLHEIENKFKGLDDIYLRKDRDDTAHGFITFDAGWMTHQPVRSAVYSVGWEVEDPRGFYLTETGAMWLQTVNARTAILTSGVYGSPYYASGWAGFGSIWDMKKAFLETDFISVRKQLKVKELVVDQIRGTNGSLLVSDTNVIETVEDRGSVWRCYIDDYDGTMYMNMRVDDILRCQRWEKTSGKYYLARVTAVGDDWFELSKQLVEGEDTPSAGDVVGRWDNLSDEDRKGLIYLTASDSYNPYMDVRHGDWNATDVLKVRLGRLDGVHDPVFPELYNTYNNFGLYTNNFYGTGDLILRSTGESVSRTFEVLQDSIKMGLSEIRYEMIVSEESILLNPAFLDGTENWDFTNVIYPWLLDDQYYTANGGPVMNFVSGAILIEDPTNKRTVLQIADSTVTQRNVLFTDRTPGKYILSFSYRALLPFGKIEVGIPGTPIFISRPLSEDLTWQYIEVTGDWDGTGDFRISVPGGVANIMNVSFTSDALTNAINQIKVEYDTKLTFYAEKAVMNSFRDEYDAFERVVRRDYATQTWTYNAITSEVGIILNGRLQHYSTTVQTAYEISNSIYDLNLGLSSRITQEVNSLNISFTNRLNEVKGVTDAFYNFSSEKLYMNRRIEIGAGTGNNFVCQGGIAPNVNSNAPAFWLGSTFAGAYRNSYGDVTAPIVMTHNGDAWFANNKIKFSANGRADFKSLRVTDYSDTNVLCVGCVFKLTPNGTSILGGSSGYGFMFRTTYNVNNKRHYYDVIFHQPISSRTFFITQGLFNESHDGGGLGYGTVEKISDLQYRFYTSDDSSTNPRDLLVMMCYAPGWYSG